MRGPDSLMKQEFLSYSRNSEYFVSAVISNSYGVSYPVMTIRISPTKNSVSSYIASEQDSISKAISLESQNLEKIIYKENKRINSSKEYRQFSASYGNWEKRITEDV